MIRNIQILLIICAYILHINAPYNYSYIFCQYCFFIFLTNAIITCKKSIVQNNSILTFDILFTFAFFYTNYIYGLILYQINPNFSLFRLEFNENYICKGISLATLGYSAYSLGYSCQITPFKLYKQKNINTKRFKLIKYIVLILSIILLILMIPKFGMNYNETNALNFGTLGNYIYSITFIVFYFIIIILFTQYKQFHQNIIKDNLIIFSAILILNIGLLSIGSRTIPLRLILLTTFLYNLLVKPIPKKYLLTGGVIGLFFMYFIGATREGGYADSISDNPLIEMGNELIINNRSLFVLIEYADNKGITFGKTMLMNILSVVPFAQGLFLSIFGWTEADINSAYLVTDLYFGSRNVDRVIGLGTNVIGDIYLSFGTIGVIICMYLFGYYLNKISCKKDLKSIIIYSMFICNSIYYTRSGILTPIREITWILLLYYWCLSKQYKISSK